MNIPAATWPEWFRANAATLLLWNELRGLAMIWAFGSALLKLHL